MRDARPYPVDAPRTRTFFGPAWPGGIFPRTPAIHRSTLRRHPSGCAFTQMKPRERRLTICCGIYEVRYVSAAERPCPPGHGTSAILLGTRRRFLYDFAR